LKNPDEDIMSLKGAGLDAMEVYRCDRNVDGTESSVASRCQTQRDGPREEHNRWRMSSGTGGCSCHHARRGTCRSGAATARRGASWYRWPVPGPDAAISAPRVTGSCCPLHDKSERDTRPALTPSQPGEIASRSLPESRSWLTSPAAWEFLFRHSRSWHTRWSSGLSCPATLLSRSRWRRACSFLANAMNLSWLCWIQCLLLVQRLAYLFQQAKTEGPTPILHLLQVWISIQSKNIFF
jgi:hypothetical protein